MTTSPEPTYPLNVRIPKWLRDEWFAELEKQDPYVLPGHKIAFLLKRDLREMRGAANAGAPEKEIIQRGTDRVVGIGKTVFHYSKKAANK